MSLVIQALHHCSTILLNTHCWTILLVQQCCSAMCCSSIRSGSNNPLTYNFINSLVLSLENQNSRNVSTILRSSSGQQYTVETWKLDVNCLVKITVILTLYIYITLDTTYLTQLASQSILHVKKRFVSSTMAWKGFPKASTVLQSSNSHFLRNIETSIETKTSLHFKSFLSLSTWGIRWPRGG